MGTMGFRSEAATTFAENSDRLFFALLVLTLVFTAIVAGMVIFLAVRYRRGNNVDRTRPLGHNTLLELTWSVIPLVLAVGVFVWSTKLYSEVYAVPGNAKEIFIIGKQWMWHLQHENGIRENNELHIPVDEPVKFTMISQDVIHAFYVPEFRIQRQVQPGEYTSFWVKPTKVGKYHLFCNMYCGTQHSEMGGWVYVQSKADYQRWLASGGSNPVAIGGINTPKGGLTLPQQGAVYFNQYQCSSCHAGEAVSRGRGPSLTGIYGKSRQLTGGRVVTADDGYLRNVQLYPNEYPLAGWPQGMPSYKGVLTEEQILAINSYIKTLDTKKSLGNTENTLLGVNSGANGAPGNAPGGDAYSGQHQGGYGPAEGDGGSPNANAPAANTNNQQWHYMYGGEQYE